MFHSKRYRVSVERRWRGAFPAATMDVGIRGAGTLLQSQISLVVYFKHKYVVFTIRSTAHGRDCAEPSFPLRMRITTGGRCGATCPSFVFCFLST